MFNSIAYYNSLALPCLPILFFFKCFQMNMKTAHNSTYFIMHTQYRFYFSFWSGNHAEHVSTKTLHYTGVIFPNKMRKERLLLCNWIWWILVDLLFWANETQIKFMCKNLFFWQLTLYTNLSLVKSELTSNYGL